MYDGSAFLSNSSGALRIRSISEERLTKEKYQQINEKEKERRPEETELEAAEGRGDQLHRLVLREAAAQRAVDGHELVAGLEAGLVRATALPHARHEDREGAGRRRAPAAQPEAPRRPAE